ncbi:YchE family NAAT transporter [Vibrio fluvialis]|uniref:YchE family NAAT transporter n=1 Tax=Vibrio fluvialis TaxID=676 RepID=UPI001F296F22|nr:YchE family NAAT transporter [Vibrio fluvialis]MCE7596857.1 YchE family NAAT transporter [Vibrio fluvialis]
MHFEFAIFLQFFLGLVAAVNPVGIMPIFVSLTGHMTPDEKKKTARTANVAVAVILITALLGGQMLLDMFSISLDSFRVAGGLLLLSIAFSMMSGKLGEDKQNKQEKSEYISREQVGVVPLAMPLMAGPGAISSTIVYGSRYPAMMDTAGIILTILVFSVASWLLFRSAPYIVRLLGQTGINVITRIMGLILGALGIEFITNGLRSLFPGLA